MLGGIVKRHRPIVVLSALRDVSRFQQGRAHEAMAHHERNRRSLLFGKCQELRRQLTHSVAVERHIVRDPEAVEDREQQQRVVGRLSERFSLFDQQTRSFRRRLGFRRGVPFHMNEWGYERDLKLDLLATQRGVAVKVTIWSRARVSCATASTNAERASDRCPALAPQARGLLDQPGLGAVTRQQLRLALGDRRELALEGFGDAGMQRAARFAQQRAVGRVLHQSMLKQVTRMRRHALPEQ